MDIEEFCLRWNNHHNILVSVLDALLEKESLVDVTLASEGRFIRVHRLVLCACSQYFEEMLCQQVDKHAIIFLKDVKFGDLKALVDYMYRGEVNVNQDQLASFLSTAEALRIKGLAYKEDASKAAPQLKNLPKLSKNIASESSSSRPPSPQPSQDSPHVIESRLTSLDTNTSAGLTVTNARTVDDDSYVSVDTKLETEMEEVNEENAEVNDNDWSLRELNTKMHEGEEDWSNSDGGIIGMPASDSSPNHAVLPDMVTNQDVWNTGDGTAGPSGTKLKSDKTLLSANSAVPRDNGLKATLICAECGRCYTSRSALLRHYRYECGVEPRFQCSVCNQRFKRNERLTYHLRHVHMIETFKRRKRTSFQVNANEG